MSYQIKSAKKPNILFDTDNDNNTFRHQILMEKATLSNKSINLLFVLRTTFSKLSLAFKNYIIETEMLAIILNAIWRDNNHNYLGTYSNSYYSL